MGDLFSELIRLFPHVAPRPCRKIGHVTRASADAQLASIRSSPDCVSPETLTVYRCHSCGQFHVGHDREGAHQ